MSGVLPIITVDQRLAAKRGIKGCIFATPPTPLQSPPFNQTQGDQT